MQRLVGKNTQLRGVAREGFGAEAVPMVQSRILLCYMVVRWAKRIHREIILPRINLSVSPFRDAFLATPLTQPVKQR